MKRIRLVATATAVLALTLTGCASLTSPAVITTPYLAADGVSGDLGTTGVKLRNFVVVGDAKGSPAELVGAIVNDGPRTAQVQLQSDPGQTSQPVQTKINVAPGGSIELGPGERPVVLPQLPVEPGSLIGVSAATTDGGSLTLQVPVYTADTYYSGITPAATTGAPTPSDSSSAVPSDEPTGRATPSSTDTVGPTGTSTVQPTLVTPTD